MAEKELGIIGQMYEERKTGKKGKLYGRNADDHCLTMESPEDGSLYNVSNSSFRSAWRKVKEEIQEEEKKEITSDENVGIDEIIASFENYLKDKRDASVSYENNIMTVKVDNMIVLTVSGADGSEFTVKSLPDIFSDSDWSNIIILKSVWISLENIDGLSVSFSTKPTTLYNIIEVVKEAVKEIKLEGYNDNWYNDNELESEEK